MDLITKINNYKQQIIEMYFDPSEVSKWAAEHSKAKRKGKKSSAKRRRWSGIEMYSLGKSVKFWR